MKPLYTLLLSAHRNLALSSYLYWIFCLIAIFCLGEWQLEHMILQTQEKSKDNWEIIGNETLT